MGKEGTIMIVNKHRHRGTTPTEESGGKTARHPDQVSSGAAGRWSSVFSGILRWYSTCRGHLRTVGVHHHEDAHDKVRPPLFQPAPEVSVYERTMLTQVETVLLGHQRRILVYMNDDTKNAPLAFHCIDHLLRDTPMRRVLVLVGNAALKPDVRHAFDSTSSLVDGERLQDVYRVQDSPTVPLQEETQLCFATLREIQALLPRPVAQDAPAEEQSSPMPRSQLTRETFDLILVYGDVSPYAQTLVKYVMNYFQSSSHLGFSSTLSPQLLSLFRWNLICTEARQETLGASIRQVHPEYALSPALAALLEKSEQTVVCPYFAQRDTRALLELLFPENG